MAELEVAEADVVVGVVDLGGCGETLNDIPHDREAFPVIPRLVKAAPGVQDGVGAEGVVLVFLTRGGLEVEACLVEILGLFQQVVGEAEVRVEADRAAGIALDHGFPDLQRLLVLANLKPCVARLHELARRAILDEGAALGFFFLGLGNGEEKEQEEPQP
jgi:hypothetical protein